MKRFLRKNTVLILVILVIGVVAYNYTYTEGFQSNITVGASCTGTSQLGTCPSGFTRNTSAGKCERSVPYCSDSGNFILQSNGTTCVNRNNRSITRPALSRIEQRDYTCPTGMVKRPNLTCLRTGSYICPSGSVRSNSSSYPGCIICPRNTSYTGSLDFCNRAGAPDEQKVKGQIINPVCSV